MADFERILDILWKANGCKDIVASFETDPNGYEDKLLPVIKALGRALDVNHRALLQHLLIKRFGSREVFIKECASTVMITPDLEAFTKQDIDGFTAWCLKWGEKQGIKINL